MRADVITTCAFYSISKYVQASISKMGLDRSFTWKDFIRVKRKKNHKTGAKSFVSSFLFPTKENIFFSQQDLQFISRMKRISLIQKNIMFINDILISIRESQKPFKTKERIISFNDFWLTFIFSRLREVNFCCHLSEASLNYTNREI